MPLLVSACSDDAWDHDTTDGALPALETPVPPRRSPRADALDALYSRERVLEIVVELDPSDWEALRGEGRPLSVGFLGGQDEPFTYTKYAASVSVDGRRFENVTARKKGFLGSLSRPRPSLKLDFGEVEDAVGSAAGRTFERLTLNNNRGDYTRARTCLAYDLFARAGVPAPRCNLAHVVVNSEDLGTYSNVEPVTKPLLVRLFGDATGALYEGQLSDFVAESIQSFQLKSDDDTDERGELASLASTLETRNATILPRLEKIIDLPRFREFWAMETLLGHWDGYAGNRNNFYVYDNPATGRFEFIPWGTDAAFADSIPGDLRNTGHAVYANGVLANRLYQLPQERAHFRTRLRALNDEVWDSASLEHELERLSSSAADALPGAVAALSEHLRTHQADLRTELREAAPEWVERPRASPCLGTMGDVHFGFSTDFGELAELSPGLGRFDVSLSLDGEPLELSNEAWFGRAGVELPSADPTITLRALGSFDDGSVVLFQASIPPEEFSPGRRALHGFETAAIVMIFDGVDDRFVGFVSDGELALEAASDTPFAPVIGRLDAKLMQTGCAALK